MKHPQATVRDLHFQSPLDQIVRQGAQRMLQAALEAEVAAYIEQFAHMHDENGHRRVVRNGHQPARRILTPVGALCIKKPRIDDQRPGHHFISSLLPRYMRRSPLLDALIPALYLKGVSTGDFTEALKALLGPNAPGLSPANIVRLKQGWQDEYEAWQQRDLSGKQYVYFWADGIYFNVRLSKDRPCMLVLMGATAEGKKELIGLLDGERESKLSWKALLLELKRRGLNQAPRLATADGGLGFWPALEEVYPETGQQRCWVHKIANVLDKLPKSLHATAKSKLHQMYQAPSRQEALKTLGEFESLFSAKYPKAVQCLLKDRSVLFTFYDFPAAHWQHLRTTNLALCTSAVESTFATVRHRTRQTKGCGSRAATLMMVYKLSREAEKRWRRLNGHRLIPKVLVGVRYEDGEETARAA